MGVSKNRGTHKSSILIGFSIINHPFWGTTIFETPMYGRMMTMNFVLTENQCEGTKGGTTIMHGFITDGNYTYATNIIII